MQGGEGCKEHSQSDAQVLTSRLALTSNQTRYKRNKLTIYTIPREQGYHFGWAIHFHIHKEESQVADTSSKAHEHLQIFK